MVYYDRMRLREKILELFKKPFVHIIFITLLGFLAYFNTFHVPFHFDDALYIVNNSTLRDLNNFWTPTGSRWFGSLTFALNYNLGGLNTCGYHIFNLTIHLLNAILVYWLVVLTFKTPFFSKQYAVINTNAITASSIMNII